MFTVWQLNEDRCFAQVLQDLLTHLEIENPRLKDCVQVVADILYAFALERRRAFALVGPVRHSSLSLSLPSLPFSQSLSGCQIRSLACPIFLQI